MRIVLLVVVLLLGGCTTPTRQETAEPVDRPSASETPSVTPDREGVRWMLVLALRTLTLDAARTAVDRAGLELRVRPVPGTACRLADEVLRQRPHANSRLPLGSRVTVEVNVGIGRCGLGLPPAPRMLDQLARRFVDYARGRREVPPANTPITLYLGGREVATVSPDDPRAAWSVCPPEGGYALFGDRHAGRSAGLHVVLGCPARGEQRQPAHRGQPGPLRALTLSVATPSLAP